MPIKSQTTSWRLFRVLAVAGVAAALAGCASSETGDRQSDPQRRQERPPAANELPPPSNPGTIGRISYTPATGTAFRESAIAELEALLGDTNPQIRANAIEGLLGAPARLKPQLGLMLTDPSPGVRAIAATAVGDARLAEFEDAVRPLTADPSAYVRASAIYALGVNGHEVDQTPLAAMLLNDPGVRVRAHAASMIGRLGNTSALPMLEEAAAAPMPRAEQNQWRLFDLQIAEAMVRLKDDSRLGAIRSALFQTRPEDIEIALVAAQILADLDDRASIASMINLAGQTDPSGNGMPLEVQLGVAAALARMGAPANEALVLESAGNADAPLRALAAHALCSTSSDEGIAALGELLSDPDARVRAAAGTAVLRRDVRTGGLSGGFSAGVR